MSQKDILQFYACGNACVLMPPERRIDVETLMKLLRTVDKESREQNLTTTKILRLATMRSLHTLYAYVGFACKNGLMRVVAVQDPRPFGVAKYYYLTRAGERLLQAWKQAHASKR